MVICIFYSSYSYGGGVLGLLFKVNMTKKQITVEKIENARSILNI